LKSAKQHYINCSLFIVKIALFRRSSAVEQLTVNQLVVGSIPTAGANKINNLAPILPHYKNQFIDLNKLLWLISNEHPSPYNFLKPKLTRPN
jgi:hypothetical protein